MRSYLTRLAILAPAIIALSGGAAALDHVHDAGRIDKDGVSTHFYNLKMVPVNTLPASDCTCKYLRLTAPETGKKKSCNTPSPAERMGITIRVASV